MKLTTPQAMLAFFAFLLLTVCATARGEEETGVYFQHGDWEIACDNTLTCRMAGYYPEDMDYDGIYDSVLITRADAPLAGQARLADDGGERKKPSVLTLRVRRFSAESAARANSGVCPFLSRASLTRTESRNGGTQS
jgi:hypothetical protein